MNEDTMRRIIEKAWALVRAVEDADVLDDEQDCFDYLMVRSLLDVKVGTAFPITGGAEALKAELQRAELLSDAGKP